MLVLLTVKVKTHVSSYFPNRPHMHLQTDPTEQVPPDSDGIWTKSTTCLLYLSCAIPPEKQMSGKSSVWSGQVLFIYFYFKNIFFIVVNLLARAQILPWMTYSALLVHVYRHVQRTGQIRSEASGEPSAPLVKKSVYYQWYEGVDWIHLAEETDQWRALVSTAMNVRIP
jgi:hypothetical protein